MSITTHLESLPDSILLNGVPHALAWREAPWGYECADVLGTVVVLRFGDRCMAVINTRRDLSEPAIKLRFPNDPNNEIVNLWPQTGYLALGTGVPEIREEPPTGWIYLEMWKRCVAENYDTPQTWVGGSAGVDNGWHPFFLHADKHGWSPLHERWAYGFLAYQLQRPRYTIEPLVGAPYGLAPLSAPVPALTGWSGNLERYRSPTGMNPLDAMHLDGTELYEAWKRTKNIEFVWAHAVMWAWARRRCPLLLRKDTKYSGVHRVPAYSLREINRLGGMLVEVGGTETIRNELLDDFLYHRDKVAKLLAQGDGWFTTDNIKDNAKHHKPWMDGPLAQILREIGETERSDALLDRLETEWFDDAAGMAYVVNFSYPERSEWTHQVPGAVDWWMRALIEGGRADSPVGKYLQEKLKDEHKTLHGVSRLAPLIGWM